MDVRVEATPFVADVVMVKVSVIVFLNPRTTMSLLSLVERVASLACPTMGSHSLSAVAPDTIFRRGLASAV